MRFFLFLTALFFLSFPTTANAAGCNAINKVLGKIPGAFKTISYYEGFRFHLHKRGFKSSVKLEVKCNTNNLFETLETTLNLLCSTVDSFSGGASSPLSTLISGKLSSIESKLTAIGGAENKIADKAKLGDYLNNKMVGIDNDISSVTSMANSANTKPTNSGRDEKGWIKFKHRKSCRSSNKKDGSNTMTPEEGAAESAADTLANAKEKAEEAQENFNFQKRIRDIAKIRMDALIAQFGNPPRNLIRASCNSVEPRDSNFKICRRYKPVLDATYEYENEEATLVEFETKLNSANAALDKAQKAFDAAMSKVTTGRSPPRP